MKKNLLKFGPIIILTILFPVVAFAIPVESGCSTLSGLGKTICQIRQILNAIIPVLIALGLVYFVWGVVRFVIADSEEVKKKGKDTMIYGVIGFAVIVGLWGLVNIVVNTFNLGGQAPKQELLTVEGASCTLGDNSKLQDLLCYVTKIINDSIIPLIFAVALVAFVWGVVQFFFLNVNEEAKRAQGKQFMIWGIIALAVMLSVWGLVGILGNTFGIDGSFLPKVRPPGGSNTGGGSGNICNTCSSNPNSSNWCGDYPQCAGD
ncbi:MAG: hypothetical protein UW07_C0008G0019 [Candidatus Nomurabacteria bacterium GW2011_GWF2_43_8]|uniref:Uncharacterized protein n=3 Tax=Candidatus Nomuraibacteriota TaxID=1752729 RepID=A0A0G1HYT2_9BACT|nr:MAG: hypothetical protein UV76_C0015G0004 [Candidatus Nomurabacteria bacterium GW2011_GWA2_43_15]KKT19364.1 MAG: hypothetical protein UW02_C0011G0015 [Candidatus Nomurabacteria bacterium GW2011_GWB1_43_7]KKT24797.1 MAG: hypothetical protein UW07_C0008G0019 [Candidatus Nomurabacteria bacterium GW2011_GWF2_43_8]